MKHHYRNTINGQIIFAEDYAVAGIKHWVLIDDEKKDNSYESDSVEVSDVVESRFELQVTEICEPEPESDPEQEKPAPSKSYRGKTK